MWLKGPVPDGSCSEFSTCSFYDKLFAAFCSVSSKPEHPTASVIAQFIKVSGCVEASRTS